MTSHDERARSGKSRLLRTSSFTARPAAMSAIKTTATLTPVATADAVVLQSTAH